MFLEGKQKKTKAKNGDRETIVCNQRNLELLKATMLQSRTTTRPSASIDVFGDATFHLLMSPSCGLCSQGMVEGLRVFDTDIGGGEHIHAVEGGAGKSEVGHEIGSALR